MEIKIENTGDRIVVSLIGRLDTITVGELEQQVLPLLKAGTDMLFDCNGLEYISSSGLRLMRLILLAHKKLSASEGRLALSNVAPSIKSIFDMTGFTSLLNFE